jgi:hypothetical protein
MTAERYGVAFSTRTLGVPVRVVCDSCHSWVNANVEGPAHHVVEPLVFGEAADVSDDDAAHLATWIAYNAMIRWVSADESFSGFAPEDFATIRETVAPPLSHVIWIGARPWYAIGGVEPVEPWRFRPNADGIVGFTLQLAFAYLTAPADAEPPWHEGQDHGALVRVWPDPQAFSWPPDRLLDRESYERVKQGLHPLPD